MKKLVLHINDAIYEDVKRFLKSFSSDKIEIKEETSEKAKNQPEFTYQRFEDKWAGLLSESGAKDWKKKRIDYLNEKHS